MANHELDQLFVENPTAEPFTVKWGGVEYTLNPGEKKIWMRFLAEHFAKHLANAILMRKEQAHKKDYLARGLPERDYSPKSYMNSREMRPATIATILTGVYEYHQGNTADPTAIIQQQIDQMNPQQPREREIDAGDQVDPLFGIMKSGEENLPDAPEQPPAPQPQPVAPQPAAAAAGQSMIPEATTNPPAPQQPAPAAPQSPEATAADNQTMKELQAEAKKLGITVPFGSNKDQVRDLIRKQYA